MRTITHEVLLCLGVACELLGCLGVLFLRGTLDRLHYTGPCVLGAVLIAAAIGVRDGLSLIFDKALLTAAFLLVTGPLLSHVTGRAARVAEHGDWRSGIGDEIEVEER